MLYVLPGLEPGEPAPLILMLHGAGGEAAGRRALLTGLAETSRIVMLPEDLPWGQLSPVAGHAAYEYIRVASELAMAGKV